MDLQIASIKYSILGSRRDLQNSFAQNGRDVWARLCGFVERKGFRHPFDRFAIAVVDDLRGAQLLRNRQTVLVHIQ